MMMLTPTRRQSLLLLCGLLMIAATLRVTFTGVAPLLEMIRASYGLTTAQTGLLTTLPLLAFAMVSPMVARIAGRYGMEKSLAGALILMMAGIAIRSLNGAGWLFTGTALIGCAIATGNVLLPGLIKRDFPGQVAKLTGAYSLTMGMAAALGSAFVVPLAVAGPGWRGALLSMMIFPLLALVIWLTQCRRHVAATLTASGALRRPSLWRSARAWQVTLFLGLNSLVYYVVIGWLPSIWIQRSPCRVVARIITAGDGVTGFADPAATDAGQRSPGYSRAGVSPVRPECPWLVADARFSQRVGDNVRSGLGRHHDPWADIYWLTVRFGASGRRAIRNGTIGGLFTGGLRSAGDGENSRSHRRLGHIVGGRGGAFPCHGHSGWARST